MLRAPRCGCCHAFAIPRTVRAGRHGPSRWPRSAGRRPHVSTPRDAGPLPPALSPVRGPIDFHTHAAPDVFGRALGQTMGREVPGALLMG